jgi:uncharacterized protein
LLSNTWTTRLVNKNALSHPTPEEQRIVGEHLAYLKAKFESGEIVQAELCLDNAFGVVVFRARSEAEATRFMNSDPAIRQGVTTAEFHPFHVTMADPSKLL